MVIGIITHKNTIKASDTSFMVSEEKLNTDVIKDGNLSYLPDNIFIRNFGKITLSYEY